MIVDTQSRVGPLGYWAGCYRKYATFTGRARRAEYWWFTLINLIIYVVVLASSTLVGDSDVGMVIVGVLFMAYALTVIVPTLAVTCRRLHDAGLSGWWQLVGFIPLLGIVIFIMTLLGGNPGPNKYGPDPR